MIVLRQMAFRLEAFPARGGLDAASQTRLSTFLQRIQAMPSNQRDLEPGEKYRLC